MRAEELIQRLKRSSQDYQAYEDGCKLIEDNTETTYVLSELNLLLYIYKLHNEQSVLESFLKKDELKNNERKDNEREAVEPAAKRQKIDNNRVTDFSNDYQKCWQIAQKTEIVGSEDLEPRSWSKVACIAALEGNKNLIDVLLEQGKITLDCVSPTLTSYAPNLQVSLLDLAVYAGKQDLASHLSKKIFPADELSVPGVSSGVKNSVESLVPLTLTQAYPQLHLAAQQGNIQLIKSLIDRGAEINEKYGESFLTPLHFAVQAQQVEAVRILLENRANPNGWDWEDDADSGNRSFETPLIIATEKGNIEIVELLLKHEDIETEVTSFEHYEQTALHRAAELDNVEIMTLLIRNGASLAHCSTDERTSRDEVMTVAMVAAAAGSINVLQYLQESNSEILQTVKQGRYTALHYAVRDSVLDKLREKRGLERAAGSANSAELGLLDEQLKVVKLLLKEIGREKNSQHPFLNGNWTPLHLTSRVEIVQELLTAGADINVSDKDGESPLYSAVRCNCLDLAAFYLRQNPPPKLLTRNNRTLFHAAAESGSIEVLKWVQQRLSSDDINAQDSEGDTAFHLAVKKMEICVYDKRKLTRDVREKYLNCLKWLVSQGADINIQNKQGETALHFAAKKADLACLLWLLKQQSVALDYKNKAGKTALHFAAVNAISGAYMHRLLSRGANPMLMDNNKETAQDDVKKVLDNYDTYQAIQDEHSRSSGDPNSKWLLSADFIKETNDFNSRAECLAGYASGFSSQRSFFFSGHAGASSSSSSSSSSASVNHGSSSTAPYPR